MSSHQPAITQELTRAARYLQFQLRPGADPRAALSRLSQRALPNAVIGLGHTLISALSRQVPGMHELPAAAERGIVIPSTPNALWIWLRGSDRGELLIEGQALIDLLHDAFTVCDATEGFMYREGRDLSGYVDGTENPHDEKALAAAIVTGAGAGLDGGSFVAVQRFVHDLSHMRGLDESERDAIFGRRHSDNQEMADAHSSAHVKRTAQESFEPQAFILRRSMPWADPRGEGLMFVAFGHSFDAYEALLGRMLGREDGITDALFRFTRAVTGNFYWCPPSIDARLDLSALGL